MGQKFEFPEVSFGSDFSSNTEISLNVSGIMPKAGLEQTLGLRQRWTAVGKLPSRSHGAIGFSIYRFPVNPWQSS